METLATKTIRVIIVDDEPLLREGVATVLEHDPVFRLVGEAGSVADAEEVIRKTRPDVAIVDYRLPGDDGSVLCKWVRRESPQTRILMLSRHKLERVVMNSFAAGADGFLVKDAHPERIRDALRTVSRGECFVDTAISEQVVRKALRSQRARNPYGLTDQERRALALVDRGLRTQQIGEHLGITVETVKTHIKHALRKLGVDDRRSAAALARRNGLFDDLEDL